MHFSCTESRILQHSPHLLLPIFGEIFAGGLAKNYRTGGPGRGIGSSPIRLPLLFYLDSVSLEMVLRTIRSVGTRRKSRGPRSSALARPLGRHRVAVDQPRCAARPLSQNFRKRFPIAHSPTFAAVRALTTRETGLVETKFGRFRPFHQFKVRDRENAGFPIHDAPGLNDSFLRR